MEKELNNQNEQCQHLPTVYRFMNLEKKPILPDNLIDVRHYRDKSKGRYAIYEPVSGNLYLQTGDFDYNFVYRMFPNITNIYISNEATYETQLYYTKEIKINTSHIFGSK